VTPRRSSNVLSNRALNRALLERQLLLRRSPRDALEAIERLVGLQAQVPNSPYLALWSRLNNFRLDDLTRLISARRVVRLALMRSTIHMVSARDCLALRPLLQPVQDRGMTGTFGGRLAGIDLESLAAAGRALVEERPRTLGELGSLLKLRWPSRDPEALAYAVRALVPLVQVPPRGVWGDRGAAACTSVDTWLRRGLATKPSMEKMILRYLAAFGPASVRDVQAWSGLSKLREPIEQLRPRLRTFADEQGVELFDLPDAPRPSADVDAPPRFLPEFDNVWLGHKDRSRVVAVNPRPPLIGSGGLLSGTVLVDGFVGARWKIARARDKAILTIDPLAKLTKKVRASIEREGQSLLLFAAADAEGHDVRVVTCPPRH
jgi:hypothetical protein